MIWKSSAAALAVAAGLCGAAGAAPVLAASPAIKACALRQAVGVEESANDEFCARRTCVSPRDGTTVCHCVGNDGSFLRLSTPAGERRLPLDSASQALGLQSFTGDIDGEAGDEVALALHTATSNGLGVRYWTVYAFDGELKTLRTFWATAEFGAGSLAQPREGKGCEVVATEFADGSDPQRGGGTYFEGRFYRLVGNALAPIAGRPVLRRRLLESFSTERFATEEAQPGAWLSHASVEPQAGDPLWTGQEVEGAIQAETMAPSGYEPPAGSIDQLIELKVAVAGETRTLSELGEDNYTRIRFGDAATRIAYPETYLPGGLDPQALVGTRVLLSPVTEGENPRVWIVGK